LKVQDIWWRLSTYRALSPVQASHCPFFSQPDLLAKTLLEIAAL
jgi:hypothetical protein